MKSFQVKVNSTKEFQIVKEWILNNPPTPEARGNKASLENENNYYMRYNPHYPDDYYGASTTIYPMATAGIGSCSLEYSMTFKEFEKEFLNKLPEYWYINFNNLSKTEKEEILDYLNNKFKTNLFGMSKYYGEKDDTVYYVDSPFSYGRELSYEEFEILILNKLPKYWYVKFQAGNYDKKKSKVICDYIGKISGKHFSPTTGHFGKFKSGNYYEMPCYEPVEKEIEITYEQFLKFTKMTENNQQESNVFTITRTEMKVIHDIACSSWKGKIKKLVKEYSNPFTEEVKLPKSVVKDMFNAAGPVQKNTLKKIFPSYSEKTIEKIVKELAKGTVYYSDKGIIFEDGFVKLELPHANKEWSFEAFDLCKAICSACADAYPIHAKGLNENYLYIKIVKV